MEGTRESCTCSTCVRACHRKPGWFLPGEAEKAAELMGLPMQEFFDRYLAIDWFEEFPDADYRDVFVLSPAVVGNPTGEEFPGEPGGTCVFLQDERCTIHAAKPHECARSMCSDTPAEVTELHRRIAGTWVDHHAQLVELLGDEPLAEPYGGGFLGLGGMLRWD